MQKSVVVLLALYNGEKYIIEQLKSLLNQSYKINRVLIGDDGSTDNSILLIEEFITKNNLQDSWFVFRNEKNLGHAGNFINLCKKVEEDYVFFCDQDDIWFENKVGMMIGKMEELPDCNLLYADVVNFNETDYKQGLTIRGAFSYCVEKIPFKPKNYWFKGLGCGSCIKGTFMKRMLPYWTEGWEHDMFFWSCSNLTNSGYRFDAPVIYRRIHNNNASIGEKKTYAKRKKQVELAVCRPDKLVLLINNEQINAKEIVDFISGYKKVLLKRKKALEKRNPFIMLPVLFYAKNYYLYGIKGALADIFLIIKG